MWTKDRVSKLAARVARKTVEIYGPWEGSPATNFQGSAVVEVEIWTYLEERIANDVERGEALTSGYVKRLIVTLLKVLNENAVEDQNKKIDEADLDPEVLVAEEDEEE